MGRFIRMLGAVMVLFGTWRAASAQMDQLKFEEAVKHVATFSAEQDAYAVKQEVMKEAKALNLPVEPTLIFVRKDDDRIHIELTYIRTIKVLPFFSTNWPFAVVAESTYLTGGKLK